MAQENYTYKIEEGNIYFFFRPKIEETDSNGEQDIERFYMVLSPSDKKIFRFCIIGKKELPEEKGDRNNWGFIYKIFKTPNEIKDELDEDTYSTKTRGERKIQRARPAGEGVYSIVEHSGHTHLVYLLELPKKSSDVQKEFNIEKEGNFIINIKNPDKPSPKEVGLSQGQKADYPKNLLQEFDNKRFTSAKNTKLLDYEGVEFILIETGKKISEDLGIDIDIENKTQDSADIFSELKLNKEKFTSKPLFEGKWD